jgi:AI-2 transport protein TqsA
MMVAGVELAVMFAMLTFLLNFIPSIGSIVAVIIPLPVILLQYGFGWQFWFVLAFAGMVQFVIGNVLEPKMMGESLGLHPVTVLLFLMFWGLVWGIPGMFLAVPITAILKIVLCRIPTTVPVANLLAGKLPD